jgi:hypothetical protein
VLCVAFAATFASPAVRAQDLAVELLWQACPYLLGTAAEVALKRLQLPAHDVEAVADLTCNVAQAYQDIAAAPPSAPPDDARTAEEIFCEGSFLAYCADVPGAAPVTPATRCWMEGLTLEACAVATIRAEANRR